MITVSLVEFLFAMDLVEYLKLMPSTLEVVCCCCNATEVLCPRPSFPITNIEGPPKKNCLGIALNYVSKRAAAPKALFALGHRGGRTHRKCTRAPLTLLFVTAVSACCSVARCIIGGFMGGSFGRVPDVGWLKSVQTKAVQMGGSWGQLSAAFSGFTSLSTIVRGRYVQDYVYQSVLAPEAPFAFVP